MLRLLALDIRRAFLPFWAIIKLVLGIAGRYALRLPPPDPSYPARIRIVLESLGPTYLKLGQYLATRLDILPVEICRELDKLFQAVSPMLFPEVKAAIESELHGPLAHFFPFFNEQPIATASVAQVHEGRTRSNDRVAIKVQRPGIEIIFAADIRNLRRVAALADRLGVLGRLSLSEIIEEFANWTDKEMDFTIEGRAADRMRPDAVSHEIIPIIFWEFTTPKLLTMEFLDGLSLAQIMNFVEMGREDLIQARLPDLDLSQAGHNIAYASLHQIFVRGFFHGDPHPGNILILKDNSAAFADFGICGELSLYHREALAGYIENVALGNAEEGFRYFSKLSTPTEETDQIAFEQDCKLYIPQWHRALHNPHSTLKERHMAKYFFALIGVVRRHHRRMNADTLLFWRAMNALNYSALIMAEHFDLVYELHVFFEQTRPGMLDRLQRVITDRNLTTDVAELLPRMPDYLNSILKGLVGERPDWAMHIQRYGWMPYSSSVVTKCLSASFVGLSLIIVAMSNQTVSSVKLAFFGMATLLFLTAVIKMKSR
jgi:ubiquinone biosynthesis protein